MDTEKPGNRSVVPWSLVVAGFLIVPLLVVPGAVADHEDGHKDFESHEVLDTLDSGWLISSSSGDTNARVSAQNGTLGSLSWNHEAQGTGFSRSTFTSSLTDTGCNGVTFPDLTFAIKFHDAPTGDFYVGLSFSENPDLTRTSRAVGAVDPRQHQLRYKIDSGLNVTAQIHGDAGGPEGVSNAPILAESSQMATLNVGEWYNFTIEEITCSDSSPFTTAGGSMSGRFLIVEEEQVRELAAGNLATCRGFDNNNDNCNGLEIADQTMQYFYLKDETTDAGEGVLIDNIDWGTAQEAFGTCPNPAAELFGYNYVEGVEFTDSLTTGGGSISLDDFYFFTGDMSDNAYLAKSWHTTPSQDFYTRTTLETATEGTSGTFRVVFSHVDPSAWVGADNFTSAAKGDGSTTGVFADATEVFFTETGNDWEIKIIKVNSGTRNQVGQSFVGLDPNTATSLEIGLNTESAASELVYIENDSGTRLFEVIPGSSGEEIYSLWLVGAGLAIADSYTAMNDNDGPWASSCWFWNDLEDPTLLGNPGSLPFEEGITEEPTTATPTGGIGSGIFGDTDAEAASAFFGGSTGAANFFFGALFIVGMAAAAPALTSGTRIDATPSMIAGGVLGLVMGWAFGFISGTFMFVLVVLSVAGVGLWFWGRS